MGKGRVAIEFYRVFWFTHTVDIGGVDGGDHPAFLDTTCARNL